MIIEGKIIYDVDSDGTDYLINLSNGAKYELYFAGTKCLFCGDKITKNDVKRANMNDKTDISNLLEKEVSEVDRYKFKKYLEEYLLTLGSKFSKKITEIIKL